MALVSDQILDAVLAALNGAGKPDDMTIEDHTAESLEPAWLPYGSVRPDEEIDSLATGSRTSPAVTHQLDFIVALWGDGDVPRKALAPLIAWTVKALQQDPSLGGLLRNLEPVKKKWFDEYTDQNRGMVEITFRATYSTFRSNEETKL